MKNSLKGLKNQDLNEGLNSSRDLSNNDLIDEVRNSAKKNNKLLFKFEVGKEVPSTSGSTVMIS